MADAPALPALLGVQASARGQIWALRPFDASTAKAIAQSTGATPLVAQLLAGRGVSADAAADFLHPTLKATLPDPSSFADMDKAAELILDAMQAKKRITIFADYDVDGGTAAAQLIRWGRAMGHEFGLYVPDRVAEGYGPSADAFAKLKQGGSELVITVDCGAAANVALIAASEMALPVIVVDHHMMDGAPPPAAALINPNRLDDHSGQGHLAAAGVTFMLLVALNRAARARGLTGPGGALPDLISLLGLTALGTICDVVSLTGVNRTFVAQGLKVLSQRQNPGLAALGAIAGLPEEQDFTVYHAGFVVGPRINAGGRIGHADMGAQLLSSDDPILIEAHAAALDTVNHERKHMQDMMQIEALEKAAMLPKDAPCVIVSMEGWHPGIIGIIAGRLKDRFDKPAIVIGVNDEGIGKGSGRSMPGVNLGAAIVAARNAGLLISGGGHAMAGGLTVKDSKIKVLTAFLSAHLEEEVAAARASARLHIDAVITPAAATAALIDEVERVAPFGAGNPQPVFAFEGLRVAHAQSLKGGHIRFSLEDASGARVSGVAFRADETGFDSLLLAPDSPLLHVAGRLKKDIWQGRTKIDLQLVDIARA